MTVGMKQVVIFSVEKKKALEEEINKWLRVNPDISDIQMSLAQTPRGNSPLPEMTVLISFTPAKQGGIPIGGFSVGTVELPGSG